MHARAGCLLCGEDLAYLGGHERLQCALCGASKDANARCTGGHFVCDACHGASAYEVIERTCQRSDATDPVQLAAALMKSPSVHMHGPEHHYLVPAALLVAWCNARGIGDEQRAELLREARRRAEVVKGGFCGLWGACGAAVGTGIFASLITGATPLSDREWRFSNAMTASVLTGIADSGGPRCCKRSSFLALLGAAAFLKETLQVKLPVDGAVRCEHSPDNRECLHGSCSFFARAQP